MKKHLLIVSLVFLTFSCSQAQKKINKNWLNRPIEFADIQQVTNTYHMFDSTGDKVGKMIFGSWFEDGKLVSRDTSLFDDGSVYEEAEFVFDTAAFLMEKVQIDMTTTATKLNIDFGLNKKYIKGNAHVEQASGNSDIPLDQQLDYDIVRSELYMLVQSLQLKTGDTVKFKALVPGSITISEAQLYHAGEESLTTEMGQFDCDILWLKTDGKMPSNKIWVSKEDSRKVVKFYVPGPELNMELVSQTVSY